jgi:cytochrome c oxidase assembly protein Cox11
MPSPDDPDRRKASQQAANRVLLRRLSVVVVAMFGFGYLMVPFY